MHSHSQLDCYRAVNVTLFVVVSYLNTVHVKLSHPIHLKLMLIIWDHVGSCGIIRPGVVLVIIITHNLWLLFLLVLLMKNFIDSTAE